MVPFSEAARIVGANPGSHLLATAGLGHSRILSADPFLDAILEFTDAAEPQLLRTGEAQSRSAKQPPAPRASHATPRQRALVT
jgi:hypothetical protein